MFKYSSNARTHELEARASEMSLGPVCPSPPSPPQFRSPSPLARPPSPVPPLPGLCGCLPTRRTFSFRHFATSANFLKCVAGKKQQRKSSHWKTQNKMVLCIPGGSEKRRRHMFQGRDRLASDAQSPSRVRTQRSWGDPRARARPCAQRTAEQSAVRPHDGSGRPAESEAPPSPAPRWSPKASC